VKTRDFSWNITVNFTNVKNTILETDQSGGTVTLGTYRPLNANTAFVKGMAGPQILAHDYTYDSKKYRSGWQRIAVAGKLVRWAAVLPTSYGGLRTI